MTISECEMYLSSWIESMQDLINQGNCNKKLLEERILFLKRSLELIKEKNTANLVACGEWVDKHHVISMNGMTITGTYPTCNLCGYAEVGMEKHNNYCGNCGAKMKTIGEQK